MLAVGLIGALVHFGMPAINAVGEQLWAAGEDYLLLSIPLYILLGEILMRGGCTDKMYQSLADWLNPLPGGLLHTNIGASAMFAAVSGSSVATAATIGTVAVPAFRGRGYDERLVLGSVAAGATLGILIPPSIMMIVYGVAAQVSISRLFIAGILPGLILLAIFSGYLMLWALLNRDKLPEESERLPLLEKLRRSKLLIPVVALIVAVIGSIDIVLGEVDR